MLKLEVFELDGRAADTGYLDRRSAENLRNQGYEEGYAAGWQDSAVHAADTSASQLASAVDALQRLSFTYAEARLLAEQQLTQLIETLLRRLVPAALELALPSRVAHELGVLLARDPQARLVLRCAPATVAILTPILESMPPNAQIVFEEEPAFAPAQVIISGHDQKRWIDLDPLLPLFAVPQHADSNIFPQEHRGRT